MGECIGSGGVAAQGLERELVGAGGAAQAQIDASGEQRFEGAELFGNHQGGVVGQHDAA